MVAVVLAVTLLVEMVKLAEVAPAATVTLPGTDAAALLSESVTLAPPLGAALSRVTVPVADAPPWTLVGLMVTEASEECVLADTSCESALPLLLKAVTT